MSKAKLIWIAVTITLLLVVIGRFVLARTLLSGSTNNLQANVIDIDGITNNFSDLEDSTSDDQVLWGDTLEQIEDESDVYSGKLNMAIPYWLDKDAIQWLTDQINLDEKNNITIHIAQAKNRAEYIDRLNDRRNEFDIMLAPTTAYADIQDGILALPFQENVISSFHPSVSELILSNNFSFLPFGLDPVITYSNEKISDQELIWEDIDRYILTYPSQDQIGLWFGISAVDIKLLEAWRTPLAWYTDTLEILIGSILADSNAALLAALIDPATWDFRAIYKAANTDQSKSDLDCQNNISLCLFARNGLQIWFGQMSDALHANQNSVISVLPHSSDLIQTVWGWIVPDQTDSRSAVLWWLVWYMQISASSNLPLWQYVLPVFQEKMHLDILQTKYKYIAPYIKNNDTKVLIWSKDQLQKYIDDTPLLDVLKGEYNVSLYVSEFGKE